MRTTGVSVVAKMQAVWAQEPHAVLVNPRDKAPAVGWDAAVIRRSRRGGDNRAGVLSWQCL
jgi:hypothetical protein